MVLRNLLGLLLLLAVVSAWFLIYTDWFLAFSSLLTLTGVFTWAAVVIKLLRSERRDEIQMRFEQVVLLRPGLWKWLLAAAAALLVLTLLTATIELRSYRDNSHRSLQIRRAGLSAGQDTLHDSVLPARSKRKFLLFGRGPFQVKVSGLPALDVRAGLFKPRTLDTPDDFTRAPVVLLRPSVDLSTFASALPGLSLVVERRSKRVSAPERLVGSLPFRGRAVWLGCDQQVDVPEVIANRWETNEARLWLPPIAPEEAVSLQVGDELTIYLESTSGPFPNPIYHVIGSPRSPDDYVQEIILEKP